MGWMVGVVEGGVREIEDHNDCRKREQTAL